MLRIFFNSGGVTACQQMDDIAQAFGIQRETHSLGWTQARMLAATTDEACEYDEHGLTRPDVDNDVGLCSEPQRFLQAI